MNNPIQSVAQQYVDLCDDHCVPYLVAGHDFYVVEDMNSDKPLFLRVRDHAHLMHIVEEMQEHAPSIAPLAWSAGLHRKE